MLQNDNNNSKYTVQSNMCDVYACVTFMQGLPHMYDAFSHSLSTFASIVYG